MKNNIKLNKILKSIDDCDVEVLREKKYVVTEMLPTRKMLI